MSVAYAPGRVNLIGEHTDYNGGLSLPFAIARGVTVTAIAGGDGVVVDAPGAEVFARGVAAELGVTGGVRLSIASDLPVGAGLSSSAALCVALCLAISGDDGREAVEIARLCSRVENEWAGARTGLLDQLASLLGRAGHALRIDFRSLEVEPVALDLGDWRLVTVDSGETRELGTTGYNQRRAECAEAARLLGVETLRDAPADAGLPAPLDRRVRHVAEENARVDETVAALRAGDLRAVGALLDASHTSLRDLYDVSTPAVERTVAALRDAGAAGARMMGGGFGGHVLGLLPRGTPVPDGAVAVEPGRGAHLVEG